MPPPELAQAVPVRNDAHRRRRRRLRHRHRHGRASPASSPPRRISDNLGQPRAISGNLVIVEADHNAYNEHEKAQLYEAVGVMPPLPAGTAIDADDEEAEGVLMEATIGVPRAQPGKWASCIRVVDPLTKQTLSVLELAENEAVAAGG